MGFRREFSAISLMLYYQAISEGQARFEAHLCTVPETLSIDPPWPGHSAGRSLMRFEGLLPSVDRSTNGALQHHLNSKS